MKEIISMKKSNDANWDVRERRIHTVLFFMPYNITDNYLLTNKLSQNFKLCTDQYGINPLVIVTWMDLVDYTERQFIISEIAQTFNIPEYAIYPHCNYTKQDQKDMSIDKNSLHILRNILQSSITFLSHAQLCLSCGRKIDKNELNCTECKEPQLHLTQLNNLSELYGIKVQI